MLLSMNVGVTGNALYCFSQFVLRIIQYFELLTASTIFIRYARPSIICLVLSAQHSTWEDFHLHYTRYIRWWQLYCMVPRSETFRLSKEVYISNQENRFPFQHIQSFVIQPTFCYLRPQHRCKTNKINVATPLSRRRPPGSGTSQIMRVDLQITPKVEYYLRSRKARSGVLPEPRRGGRSPDPDWLFFYIELSKPN